MVMNGMAQRKPGMAAKAWAVAVSALFLSLAAAPLSAQEPAPAVISDPITDFPADPDSDGLFEYLILKVPLTVERADIYTVASQVSIQGQGAAFSRASQELFLDSGEQSVRLTFAGPDLARLPANRSLVFSLIVLDSTGRVVDGRTYPGPVPYSGSQFEGGPGPAAPEFTGLVLEVPEDVSSDGHFGYLNITFEVRNLTTRKADVTGTLNGVVKGTGMLRTFFEANLTGNAELRFDGGTIRDLGVSGPYDVMIRLSIPFGNEVSYAHRTAAYNASDFEAPPPPVTFTGNGTDTGWDPDGDGLFEQLQVQVGVIIALEGVYTFKAALRVPDRLKAVQAILPRPTAYLDAARQGNYSVAFNVSGQVLRMLQLDGPYQIDLDAFSERVLYVTNGTYSTNGYLSSQFEKPPLPARFSGTASEEVVDKDLDGLFDLLRITVPVEVDLAGSYQLAGGLYAGDLFVAQASGRLDLPAGKGKVTLRFDGQAIRQAGFDGPYTVVLYLSAQAPGRPGIGAYLPPDTLEVHTKAYKASDFEKREGQKKPLPPPEDLEVKVSEGLYQYRAPGITVEVNRSAPDITYYYTLDDGRSARFRLVFTQLIAYTDAIPNGVYDPGEEQFQSPLSLADWEASTVESTGEQGGRVLRYNLTATLDLGAVGRRAGAAPQARIPQWGRMTFSFTVASRDQNFTRPLVFSLRGGTEMKIDILIEPGRDLPEGISGLCLQHYLSDESGSNHFRTFEEDQVRVFKPGAGGANTSIFRPVLSSLQKIGLAGSNGKEHGYYAWLPQVLVENQDGSSSYLPVNLTYSTDGRQMALALNYPLPEGTASLLHDPTVGVNATNAPEPSLSLPKILFNPWLYIVAALIAVAVVAYIRRSQRNGE